MQRTTYKLLTSEIRSFNSNTPNHYITVYAAGATRDAALIRTITGTLAQPFLWSSVYGIAVDEGE
jgi:hypothetical protein